MLRLPCSPECVEGEFCELRIDGVLEVRAESLYPWSFLGAVV